jgi:hypothetical protein
LSAGTTMETIVGAQGRAWISFVYHVADLATVWGC